MRDGRSTTESVGSKRWSELWRVTGREPFAHPDFVRLFAGPGDRPVAFCWEDDGGVALLPLVVRALPDEAQGAVGRTGLTDVVSPYGYGGPFCAGSPDLAACYAALLEWMRHTGVVSGFVRGTVVGPVGPDVDVAGARVLHLADNVVVGLGLPAEERWRRYEHKVRKNVNKARRNGLSTTVSDGFADVATFSDIYSSTMDRRSAAAFYRFDADFFAAFGRDLAGSFWVADTHDEDGAVVSTELVLRGDRTCYSFLGGTRREAFPMSPNDLLKHDVIDHAADAGLAHYVLGGGYDPGDGIFRYKKAFDPTGLVPFHGVQLMPDVDTYEAVCAASGAPDSSFFPRYRAPATAD